MKHASQRLGPAVIAAVLALGLPAQAWAQQETAVSGSQPQLLQSALRDESATIPRLAKMHAISATVIRLIPVQGPVGAPGRRHTMGSRMGAGRAALQSALESSTVETLDRPNGADQRQNTFADFLLQNNVDPKSVITVSITANPDDKQNPFVNVFYHKGAARAAK